MPPKPYWLKKKVEGERTAKQAPNPQSTAHQKKSKQQPNYLVWLGDPLTVNESFMKEFKNVSVEFGENPSKASEHHSLDEAEEKVLLYAVRKAPIPNLICWSNIKDIITENGCISIDMKDMVPIAVIPMPNAQFIQAVLKSADGVDFPEAGALIKPWLDILNEIHDAERVRVVLAFTDIMQEICQAQRQDLNTEVNVQHWIEQACIYVAMEYNVEPVTFNKYSDLCKYLVTMTRVAHNYAEHLSSGREVIVDNIQRGTKQKVKEGTVLTEKEQEKFDLRQTWVAMLQMIPLLSQEKALALVSNEQFSCPKKFYEAILEDNRRKERRKASGTSEKEDEEDLMAVLRKSFGKTKSGAVRNENKLASLVYSSMTVDDPSLPLS